MTLLTSTQPNDSVNVYNAKTHLSQLITRVENGEEIIITRNGKPAAMLVPVRASRKNRTPGVLAGKIHIGDTFDDFTRQDEQDWYGE